MMLFKKIIVYLLTALAVILLLVSIYLLGLKLIGNVHTVLPNRLYRSAQLSFSDFKIITEKKQIKTIIDLAPTYQHVQESYWASRHDMTYDYLPLEAKGRCPIKKLKILTNDLMQAKTPLLVHCKSGSDRTGLASAVYLILNNVNSQQVRKQIAYLRYGILSPYSIGRITLAPYFYWLKNHRWQTSRNHYLLWLNQHR